MLALVRQYWLRAAPVFPLEMTVLRIFPIMRGAGGCSRMDFGNDLNNDTPDKS